MGKTRCESALKIRDSGVIVCPRASSWSISRTNTSGSTTTPFDMLLQNKFDRFTLASDVLRRSSLGEQERAEALAVLANRREQAADHLRRFGVDDPALA